MMRRGGQLSAACRRFASVCALTWAAAANAMTPAVLVDPQLEEHPVSVTSLTEGTLTYFDSDRSLQRADVREVVQLRITHSMSQLMDVEEFADIVGLLTLANGQRLVGAWGGVEDAGETLIWSDTHFGDVRIAFVDVVAMQLFYNELPHDPDDGLDHLYLSNGDTLSGYLDAFTDDGVSFLLENADDPVELPIDRLKAVITAVEPIEPLGGQHTVTFLDGSRVLTDRVELARDQVLLAPSALSVSQSVYTLPVGLIERIDFTGAGYRLHDLADLPRDEVEPASAFGVTHPLRAEASGTMHLHAPSRFEVELAPSAKRFTATAELDLPEGLDPALRDWIDFELLIHTGRGQPHRFRFGGDTEPIRINVPLEGDRLGIELDAGVNGPILDRLRVRNAKVLTTATPSGE